MANWADTARQQTPQTLGAAPNLNQTAQQKTFIKTGDYQGFSDYLASSGAHTPHMLGNLDFTLDPLVGSGDQRNALVNKMNAQEMIDNLLKMDKGTLKDLQGQMVNAGYLNKGEFTYGFADLVTQKAYAQLLNEVATYQAKGQHVTPQEILKMMKDSRDKAAKASGGPKHYTETDRSVDLTDPSTAQGLVTDAITNALGRAPTPEEVTAFTSTLQATETANPQVTVSTTDTTGDVDPTTGIAKNTTKNAVQAGGVDPQQIAKSYVMANNGPEMGAYQAGTSYYNAALAALGAISTG